MTRIGPVSPKLTRLLDDVDWSRCSGRDLHRLAEGAVQAAIRGAASQGRLATSDGPSVAVGASGLAL